MVASLPISPLHLAYNPNQTQRVPFWMIRLFESGLLISILMCVSLAGADTMTMVDVCRYVGNKTVIRFRFFQDWHTPDHARFGTALELFPKLEFALAAKMI
jgi:hypothetical protein